ncbi:MAG: hypothetical protein Q8L90_10745 [Bacteroidota bacterium]|nr:hypothetical protein [Bacteroidota bacterium]
MASPQFNKNATSDFWYSLTYQSNDLLNKETHYRIKPMIAEILVTKIKIKNIHSYIHGSIVFSLDTPSPLSKFDEIITELKTPLFDYSPKLLFSLVFVGRDTSTPSKKYMYIDGSDELDKHFQGLISSFYPVKAIKK